MWKITLFILMLLFCQITLGQAKLNPNQQTLLNEKQAIHIATRFLTEKRIDLAEYVFLSAYYEAYTTYNRYSHWNVGWSSKTAARDGLWVWVFDDGKVVLPYNKVFTVGQPMPIDFNKVKVEIDGSLMRYDSYRRRRSSITLEQVKENLSKYIVVSEQEWQHGYSHADLPIVDPAGWLISPDGTRLLWRKGSVGYIIIYPDGGRVFLVYARAYKDQKQ